MSSKRRVADMSAKMTQLNDKMQQVISNTGEVSHSISVLVNQAVTSLQFEDMYTQLSQHIDKRFETLDDLAGMFQTLQQAQLQPDNLVSCRHKLDKVKQTAETLQSKIAANQHKSVTQQSLDTSDVELL